MTSITIRSLPTRADARPGEGREDRKSDARARRQQSTVPVGALRPMLTYRLTGTTEDSGFDRDEHQPSSTRAVACDQSTRQAARTRNLHEPRRASEEARRC